MNIIVCTDLIFSTKITGTAKALSQPYAVARTIDKLRELLDAQPPQPAATVIIDLNASLDTIAAVRAAKQHPSKPTVIAFLSHVQADLAAAAREAGADRILARSAFVEQLPAILAT